MNSVICRVPLPLYKGIAKLEKELRDKGLPITKPQISEKLGNDILEGKISIDFPIFKLHNQKRIQLGGFRNVKVKKR